MKSRALRNLISVIFILTLTGQVAYGNAGTAAGQLVRRLFTSGDTIASKTLRLSDDVATEFLGNLTIVKQLLNSYKGNDEAAKAANFVKQISKQIDSDDQVQYDKLVKLLKEDNVTPDDARQLHDLLVYFSYRYTDVNKPVMMYCILCSSGTGFADASFGYTFKNTEKTPFNGIISEINQKSVKEIKSEIDDLMEKLKFTNFNYANNTNLLPGQEHTFLLFLRVTNYRGKVKGLRPFKEYGKAVKDLAAQVSKESGEFFGSGNPNRLHMLVQEAIDLASNPNANATPEQVIETWTQILKDTTKALREDPSANLADTFENVIKKPLRDSKGNIPQKYLDEVDNILNRCKFVSR